MHIKLSCEGDMHTPKYTLKCGNRSWEYDCIGEKSSKKPFAAPEETVCKLIWHHWRKNIRLHAATFFFTYAEVLPTTCKHTLTFKIGGVTLWSMEIRFDWLIYWSIYLFIFITNSTLSIFWIFVSSQAKSYSEVASLQRIRDELFRMNCNINLDFQDWHYLQQRYEMETLLYADLFACTENNLCNSCIENIWLSSECFFSKTLPISFKTDAITCVHSCSKFDCFLCQWSEL